MINFISFLFSLYNFKIILIILNTYTFVGGNMDFNVGDLVTRNSYNNDVLFEIIEIKEDMVILKGVNIRLTADSDIKDLKKHNNEDIEHEKEFLDRLETTVDLDREDFFYLPGKVVQIDSDASYLSRCLDYYKKINIWAVGVIAKEEDIPGSIIEILEKSPVRKEADCATYKRCGGCSLRHIEYTATLNMKQNMVQNLVNKTLKEKIQVEKTIGMENPMHYRNKAQYPVGLNKENKPIVGIFAKRSHEIIGIEKCFIQNQISEIIAKKIIEFIKENNISVYNEQTGKRMYKAYCYKNRTKN